MTLKLFPGKINSYKSIFLVYLIITLLSLITLSIFLYKYLESSSKSTVTEKCEKIVRYVGTYMDSRIKTAKDASIKLSTNSSNLQEVLYLLKSGYDAYNTYKLDSYLNNPSIKESFEDYIKLSLSSDSDIKGFILQPLTGDKCYIYSERDKVAYPIESGFPDIVNYKTAEPAVLPERYIKYSLLNTGDNKVFSYAFQISEPYSSDTKGFLIVDFDVKGIEKALNEVNKDFTGRFLIFTGDGNTVFDNSGSNETDAYKLFNQYINVSGTRTEKEGLVSVSKLGNTGLTIMTFIPGKALFNRYFGKLILLLLWIVFIMVFIILITYITTRHFSNKVKLVINGIGQIRKGDLSYRIPRMDGKDEISDIGAGFNELCDFLDSYIKKVYVLEIEQKEAQLKALQARINPHFLFNTLEAIRMNTIIAGADEAAEMIYLLASIFRASIREKTVVSIRDELKISKMYLDLFQIRYKNLLKVDFNADSKIMSLGIIKYTMQPVIENYVLHGFDIERNDNFFNISLSLTENNIHIILCDNGKGMDKEKLEAVTEKLKAPDSSADKGFGLSSVNERIKLVFGRQYGLSIESQKGLGTEVTVTIPAMSKKEMEDYVQGIHS